MKIVRNHFHDAYVNGLLTSDHFEDTLFSLEQEWRPAKDHLGGTNNNSCVPDGIYELIPFVRPKNGLIVPQLYNPDLGVYKFVDDLPPEGGRFLNLMHPGNTPEDIEGCIACGTWLREPGWVGNSRDAQAYIMQAFNAGDRELIIESFDTREIYAKKGD